MVWDHNANEQSADHNIYDHIFLGIEETLASVYTDPDNIQKIMEQHGQIVTAIKQRSSEQAAEAMKTHILFFDVTGHLKYDRYVCASGAAHRRPVNAYKAVRHNTIGRLTPWTGTSEQ